MFDRFTDRSRRAMGLARQEALRFNHEYIGTEHILLGLVEEGSGVAAKVLKKLGVDLKKLRSEVEKLVSLGATMVTIGQIPFTPRAKKVLELSLEEASGLGHTYIGTEHLLLGLIREDEGIAAQVLRNLKVNVEDVRGKVLELLGAEPSEVSGEGAPADAAAYAGFPVRVGPLFTPLALVALGSAHRLAARRGVVVGPMHLVAGLLILAEDRSKEPAVASSFGDLDLPRLAKAAVRDSGEIASAAPQGDVSHSPDTLGVLATAMTIAADAGRSTASQTDLLAALVRDPNAPASRWLKAAGVDVGRLRGS